MLNLNGLSHGSGTGSEISKISRGRAAADGLTSSTKMSLRNWQSLISHFLFGRIPLMKESQLPCPLQKNLSVNGFQAIKLPPRIPSTKATAQELAKYKGIAPLLNGLTSIDKDVAQELAKFEGEKLWLDGLTSIDKDVAQELAKLRGESLSLGLTSMDKEVAQELAKFKGSLSLNGLTSIDKDVAQELVKLEGNLLHLDSLTSIDKDVAQELAKYDGNISLNSLTTMDINVAKCFENECECDTVSLVNLDSIGKEVVLILQTNERLSCLKIQQ